MKTLVVRLFIFSFLLISSNVMAIVSTNETTLQTVDFSSISKSEMKATLGRKVKLKEWMALKWVNKKATKHNNFENYGTGRGFAITGMVLGILGLLATNILLAVIFSAIAINRIRRSGDSGAHGMAIAGLITGAVGVVIGLALSSLFWVAFV